MKYNEIKIGGGDTGEPINVSRRINLITSYVNLNDKFILDCEDKCSTALVVYMLM